MATNLDRNIFDPQICCSHDRGVFMKNVKSSGLKVHLKKTTVSMSNRIHGMINCFSVAKFFKSLDVDLIHSMHYSDDYSEAISAKIAGIPWMFTKKNMSWGGNSKNSWKLRAFLSKHILAQNNDMIQEFFPGSNKVTLIPRGVDTKEFHPMNKDVALSKQFSLVNVDKILMCVANLAPVKGVEVLINAFDLLCANEKNLKLIIVGSDENDYAKGLRSLANSKSCRNKIYFTGRVYNVENYYSIADIFILPTLNIGRREGCPVSLLEAMASGIEVIGSNVSGINDVLQYFPDNMFNPGDEHDLYEKIKKVLNNTISKKDDLLKHVRENYDIKIEANKHANVYERILA